jgi:hypothetical protein
LPSILANVLHAQRVPHRKLVHHSVDDPLRELVMTLDAMSPCTTWRLPPGPRLVARCRASLLALLAMAALAAGAAAAQGGGSPPPLAPLTAEQSAQVDQRFALYRAEVDARVARGELAPDEAWRLLRWHEWQLTQQAAGAAPPSVIVERQAQTDALRAESWAGAMAAGGYADPWGWGGGAYGARGAPFAYGPWRAAPGWDGGFWLPRASVCVGGSSGNGFGSLCF